MLPFLSLLWIISMTIWNSKYEIVKILRGELSYGLNNYCINHATVRFPQFKKHSVCWDVHYSAWHQQRKTQIGCNFVTIYRNIALKSLTIKRDFTLITSTELHGLFRRVRVKGGFDGATGHSGIKCQLNVISFKSFFRSLYWQYAPLHSGTSCMSSCFENFTISSILYSLDCYSHLWSPPCPPCPLEIQSHTEE